MPDVSLLAMLTATIAAFLGFLYYGLLGERVAELSSAAAASQSSPLDGSRRALLRCLVLASAVAWLVGQADLTQWTDGLSLGLVL